MCRWLVLSCCLFAASAAAQPAKPGPAAPKPAKPAISSVHRVLAVSGLIVAVPVGWRSTIQRSGSHGPTDVYRDELFDELERHVAGQPEVNLSFGRVRDCPAAIARTKQNGMADASPPAWMPTAWSARGYLGAATSGYVCGAFATGSYAVTVQLLAAKVDDTTATELKWVLTSLAAGANRTELGQYQDNHATPLTVTGLMITLPVAPQWFAHVINFDNRAPKDALTRVPAAERTSLTVTLAAVAVQKCSAALKGYRGKAAKKPAYMPSGWSPRVLEIADKKAGIWAATACLQSGALAQVVQVIGIAALGTPDKDAVRALRAAVATARAARDGYGELPYHGNVTSVLARQSGLSIAIPIGPVDWEVMSFQGADVFTRGRPALPSVDVTLSRGAKACTLAPASASERRVGSALYAPVEWGPALETTSDPDVLDAGLCRGHLFARVRFPSNASARDRSDVRDLLAAIARADQP